jgi:hypothetical protein
MNLIASTAALLLLYMGDTHSFDVAAEGSSPELEKRDQYPTLYAPLPTSNVVGTAATNAYACSMNPDFGSQYPPAKVSYSPVVKKVDNNLYQGTMYFNGDNCEDFDNAWEIKLDGVQGNVVVYSHNDPKNKNSPNPNGCNWQATFIFQASYDSNANRYCMNGGSQIQYDWSGKSGPYSNSFDYSFGCNDQFQLPELCWDADGSEQPPNNQPPNNQPQNNQPQKGATTTSSTAAACVPVNQGCTADSQCCEGAYCDDQSNPWWPHRP